MIHRITGGCGTFIAVHHSGVLVGANVKCPDGRVLTAIVSRAGTASVLAWDAGTRRVARCTGDVYLTEDDVFALRPRGRNAAALGGTDTVHRRRGRQALSAPCLVDHEASVVGGRKDHFHCCGRI